MIAHFSLQRLYTQNDTTGCQENYPQFEDKQISRISKLIHDIVLVLISLNIRNSCRRRRHPFICNTL